MFGWLRRFGWMRKQLRRKQREVDTDLLWDAIKDCADGDIYAARAAFAVHALQDEAWTTDMSDAEIVKAIEELE